MTLALLLACALISADKADALRDPDGDGSPFGEDCDDTRDDVYPGAEEVCGDGVINGCDEAAALAQCGPNTDLSQAAALEGEAAGQWLGFALLGGADLNGDGSPDLAIGAPGGGVEDLGQPGAVWLETNASFTGGLKLESPEACSAGDRCDGAGFALAAGDLDGDGQADLLIGAPFTLPVGSSFFGVSYLVLGPITASASLADADAQVASGKRGALGAAVAVIAGDGQPWLALGSPYAQDDGGTTVGAVWFLAADDALALGIEAIAREGVKALGETEDGAAGLAVANAGDVDGDGADDLLVGGPQIQSGGGGEVWLVLEQLRADASLSDIGTRWIGAEDGDALSAVAGVGDVDEDGYGDVLLGAPGAQAEGTGENAGKAYLILGAAGAPAGAVDQEALGAVTLIGVGNSGAGYSVSAAGDTDGDGVPDLLIGAPNVQIDEAQGATAPWNTCLDRAGGAWVIQDVPTEGTHKLQSLLGALWLTGGEAQDCAGYAVASAGDADGDGHSDVLIGHPAAGDASAHAGRATRTLMTGY